MATSAIYVVYSKIVLDALSVSKIKLNKCRRDFMIEIFMLYLSFSSRINFLQLGRYSRFGEQRFRRQFDDRFDFFSRFFRLFVINPNSIKNRQHVNELLYFGSMSA